MFVGTQWKKFGNALSTTASAPPFVKDILEFLAGGNIQNVGLSMPNSLLVDHVIFFLFNDDLFITQNGLTPPFFGYFPDVLEEIRVDFDIAENSFLSFVVDSFHRNL